MIRMTSPRRTAGMSSGVEDALSRPLGGARLSNRGALEQSVNQEGDDGGCLILPGPAPR